MSDQWKISGGLIWYKQISCQNTQAQGLKLICKAQEIRPCVFVVFAVMSPIYIVHACGIILPSKLIEGWYFDEWLTTYRLMKFQIDNRTTACMFIAAIFRIINLCHIGNAWLVRTQKKFQRRSFNIIVTYGQSRVINLKLITTAFTVDKLKLYSCNQKHSKQHTDLKF